jgi:hypothetical protein
MISQLPTITLILAALALILSGYCAWQMVSIGKLKKTFFAGENAVSLESVIYSLKQELEQSRQQEAVLEQSLNQLKKDFAFAVQKVGLVRFNPFNDGGGNFSFCLALLDQNNTGIIITSMYGREQNRIYTKKLDQGKCDIKLTEEEEQAVEKANKKLQT